MHIIIVDDDVDCLEGLTTALEPSGYSCDAFSNPLEALASLKTNNYDVVITDINMPHMNGIDLLKNIYSTIPDARIIIITAYRDLIPFTDGLQNRVQAIFDKPLEFNKLMTILENTESQQQALT